MRDLPRCPHCNADTEHDETVEPGDLTACLNCGCALVWLKDFRLRALRGPELAKLDGHTLGLVRQVQEMATLPVPLWAQA